MKKVISRMKPRNLQEQSGVWVSRKSGSSRKLGPCTHLFPLWQPQASAPPAVYLGSPPGTSSVGQKSREGEEQMPRGQSVWGAQSSEAFR